MSETKATRKKKSPMWQFFDQVDNSYATCCICGAKVAFRSTTSNLKRHMILKHPDISLTSVELEYPCWFHTYTFRAGGHEGRRTNSDKTQPHNILRTQRETMKDEVKDRRSSKVWQLFTRIAGTDGQAKCELCGHILSYKSSTTNLAKHVQRKHQGAYHAISGTEEDPREGLKEFITIENPEAGEDEGDADEVLRDNDTEWTPPKKLLRKSTTLAASTKKVKPELISSNGVDYLIYTHEPTPQRTPLPQMLTKVPAIPQRPTLTTGSGSRTAPAPEEDEFSCFARFLSKRIRALKDPYWQSCAINEINSALHKVEMRRYEPPRVHLGSDFSVQTEPLPEASLLVSRVSQPHHDDHIEQRIVEEIVEDVVV